MRRVVITGLGMVAPTGNCVKDAWEAALACRSGAGRITSFDLDAWPDLTVHIAAEVKNFDPTVVLSVKEARQATRFVQLTAVAMHEAVQDSGLDLSGNTDRYGCSIGVGLGAFGDIEVEAQRFKERGPRRVSPLMIPYAIPNMAAGFGAIAENLRGPNFCTATACASGTHAIGEAWMHILFGNADAMVAGGSEASTSPMSIACFAKMRALSTRNDDPQAASRPFDADRDGFVMGEGSGAIVLEELEHAKRRGARIYAELVGYGLSCDAYHITSPPAEGEGAARCIQMALRNIPIDEVDYINAHGTSTQVNDAIESTAIETVFGPHAQKLSISSTKGVTGHCLGAAGAIEAVYTTLAVHQGVIPPTANLERPGPLCNLDYTPKRPRERKIRYALSNSFGFGGHNACIGFKRFE
jgi:3-oxoacyl-[acyl-carrier-protein] synthase II